MNSGNNICNALRVMIKTYENVQKLMNYTKIYALEKTKYYLAVPKFLRRKSDNDITAWLINDFILLFQHNDDSDCETDNGWKNAPIYVMEIYLGSAESEEGDVPQIYLSKFEYNDLNGWSEGCSPANNWVFYWPPIDEELMDIVENEGYSISKPKNEKASKKYWGVNKVTTLEISLMDVTSDNLEQLIFENFDKLRRMESVINE